MLADKRCQAYAMFAVGAVVLLVIGVADYYLSHRPKPGDDGCLGEFARSTVVILDRTEAMTGQTQDEIYRRIQRAIGDEGVVRTGDMVAVFTIDDLTRKQFKPIFSHCKPRASGSELTESPRAIATRKKRDFDEPLRKVLNEPVGEAAESRIAEALIDLSRTHYLRAPDGVKLLVYSDLLQNSTSLSMYHCTSTAQAIVGFKAGQQGAVQRPTFEKVSIVLNVVPRPGLSGTTVACRDGFWNWFFGDSRGSVDQDALP